MKCGPDNCPIRVFSDLTPAEQKVERKRIVEKMTKEGFTQVQIAKHLGVSQNTISLDLSNLSIIDKLKQAKTVSNPKGAGRPKGKQKPKPKPEEQKARDEKIIALHDTGKSAAEIAPQVGIVPRAVSQIIEHETIRREAKADPEIDRSTLSMTAQQKLDTAIRQHKRDLDAQFRRAVSKEIEKWGETILPQLKKEQAEISKLEAAVRRKGFMNKETFNAIRRCLHPDSRLSVSDKLLAKAFDAFMALEKYVLSAADAPSTFITLPNSMAEWAKMRSRRAEEMKTKRSRQGRNAVQHV